MRTAIYQAIIVAVITVMIMKTSEGATPCPPREKIYPCICTNTRVTKKLLLTDISCRHIPNTGVLSDIFDTLLTMQINRFIIYDSFWEVEDHLEKRLPTDWFALLKIKELQILDSELSHDIACKETINTCNNNFPTHLSIENSSSTNAFITFCEGTISFSWLNCMKRLQHFSFIKNTLRIIPSNFFEIPMEELLVANFSYNSIQEIEDGAFRNLPKLTTLDLSYNRIKSLNDIFGKRTAITYLDLSENMMIRFPPDMFKMTPLLTYFGGKGNRIQKLLEDDWKHLPINRIRKIDLIGNWIDCDCHMIWINCTLKVHTAITGFCRNEPYTDYHLRKASRFMSESCVNGRIMPKDNTTRRNACDNWSNRRNYEETPLTLLNLDYKNENSMANPVVSRRRGRTQSPKRQEKDN